MGIDGVVDKVFLESINSGTGAVVIMAGSGSDKDHIELLEKKLNNYNIPHRVHISSAHKQPEKTKDLLDTYNNIIEHKPNSSYVIIAVAGMTDALSGTAAFHAYVPVISCPPEGTSAALPKNTVNTSCLMNPPGSSNAYILRPDNAARFVAQMYASRNPKILTALKLEIAGKLQGLVEDDQKFQQKYTGEQK